MASLATLDLSNAGLVGSIPESMAAMPPLGAEHRGIYMS
jgi:hypothetical protein